MRKNKSYVYYFILILLFIAFIRMLTTTPSSTTKTTENVVSKQSSRERVENNSIEVKTRTETLQNVESESIETTITESVQTDVEKAYLDIPEKYMEDFIFAMSQAGMDIEKIANVEKIDDWYNGERYRIYYGSPIENEYNVYFLDNGKVASINYNNILNEKIYENIDLMENSDNAIEIIDGQEGEYGQVDDFSGYKTIRYYLPNGKYLVSCETRGSGFYIESIEKHLEDGFETSDIIEKIIFSDVNEEIEIEIKDGQCVSLLINALLKFKPIE